MCADEAIAYQGCDVDEFVTRVQADHGIRIDGMRLR
jgi:hypothetical protein